MLLYTKVIDGVRKIYGTTADIPADTDVEITCKDTDGNIVTPVAGDSFVDAGNGGILWIAANGEKKEITVSIADTEVIPQV